MGGAGCHTGEYEITCRTIRVCVYDTNIPLNLPRFRLYFCLYVLADSLSAVARVFLRPFSERYTPKCHTGLFVYDAGVCWVMAMALALDTNHCHHRIQYKNHCWTRASLKCVCLIASCINIQYAIQVYIFYSILFGFLSPIHQIFAHNHQFGIHHRLFFLNKHHQFGPVGIQQYVFQILIL